MLNNQSTTQGCWPRGLLAAATTALLAAAMGASAQQAPAFPELPTYELQPCCDLCPAAANPATYTGYLDGFRMMVQGKNGWLFRTEDDLKDRYA